jgi:hypothetical protein
MEQLNPAHILTHNLPKIDFNIITQPILVLYILIHSILGNTFQSKKI